MARGEKGVFCVRSPFSVIFPHVGHSPPPAALLKARRRDDAPSSASGSRRIFYVGLMLVLPVLAAIIGQLR